MTAWKEALLPFLAAHVSEHKRARFEEVLAFRTRHLVLWLEEIENLHDAGAVFRTAECQGLQEIHLMNPPTQQKLGRGVAVGASKWLDWVSHPAPPSNEKGNPEAAGCAHAFPNNAEWLEAFRRRGYRIVAVSPGPGAVSPHEIPLDQPLLLCFGGDPNGLSHETLAACEQRLHFPKGDKTLNLSTRVAAHLFPLVRRLHQSQVNWGLDEEAKLNMRLRWYFKVPKAKEQLIPDFLALHNFSMTAQDLLSWLESDDALRALEV